MKVAVPLERGSRMCVPYGVRYGAGMLCVFGSLLVVTFVLVVHHKVRATTKNNL